MVTNCKNCGLPIFHGAAGYAGAQCKCGFSAKPNYDHNALAGLIKERDQLKAENEQLVSAIRYEQHLADKIGTHGPDCWSWGNAHYECLKRKHQQDVGESILERDTLRAKLDEARELLTKTIEWNWAENAAPFYGDIEKWLERNPCQS